MNRIQELLSPFLQTFPVSSKERIALQEIFASTTKRGEFIGKLDRFRTTFPLDEYQTALLDRIRQVADEQLLDESECVDILSKVMKTQEHVKRMIILGNLNPLTKSKVKAIIGELDPLDFILPCTGLEMSGGLDVMITELACEYAVNRGLALAWKDILYVASRRNFYALDELNRSPILSSMLEGLKVFKGREIELHSMLDTLAYEMKEDDDEAVLEMISYFPLDKLVIADTYVPSNRALQRMSGLIHLELPRNAFECADIASAIAKMRHLRHLNLSGNWIDPADGALFAEAIGKATNLRHIDLSNNPLKTEVLGQTLPLLTSLEHLNLSNIGLEESAMAELTRVLPQVKSLRSLNLSDNQGHVETLPALLSQMPWLHFLDLSFMGIDDEGMKRLESPLSQMKGLRGLNLSGNLITKSH